MTGTNSPMVSVRSFRLSSTKLKLASRFFERRFHCRDHLIGRDFHGLRFHVAEPTKLLPAGFAFGDRVVGRIIREFDDGASAFEALKFDL